jgi:precorrin-6B methylase 2
LFQLFDLLYRNTLTSLQKNMIYKSLKKLLPDHPTPMRIWRGPFRGARIVMNPRDSLRKIFGFYEHELNGWLEQVLSRVTCVLDVGANDGYFTFGCAAAFKRLGKTGKIIAIESQEEHILKLRRSIEEQGKVNVTYQLVQAFAGRELKPGFITLDSLGSPGQQTDTMIKIDVEGAEMEVVEGARNWINSSSYFVIEVHEERFLSQLKTIFREQGHELIQVNQKPLRFLGRERRELNNWWLVSDLRVRY